MRIYLDNCCFNRPFDDQRHIRVRLETEAKLHIQAAVRSEQLELAWSYMLDYENSANPFLERRITIRRWQQYASVDIEETESVLMQATELATIGLKAKDALHIACACAASCDYFVTTDDIILRRGHRVEGIVVIDPVGLIRELDL